MQKVAANVDNVAADLCFRASEVRWLLMKIFFAIAASSAADFFASIYYRGAEYSAFWWFGI